MRYASDLTDTEWQHSEYCFSKPNRRGRRRKHPWRKLLNAIFSLVQTGCQGRHLPRDFAPWGTVYHSFRLWKRKGLGAQIHTHLRERVRPLEGRPRQARAAILDSPSVKPTEGSEERGDDAGKKVNGGKRPLLGDTIGWVLRVMVLPAHLQDRDGARRLLRAFCRPSPRPPLKPIWAEGGWAGALVHWVWTLGRCTLDIVKRSALPTFQVLPRCWGGERTSGWLDRYRRLNPDYQRQAHTAEIMVHLAMLRLRLARWGRASLNFQTGSQVMLTNLWQPFACPGLTNQILFFRA